MNDLEVITAFLHENWEQKGLSPLFLYLLLKKGWEQTEIDHVLSNVIGKDYADIKVGVWAERLEKQGVIVPPEEPFIELMDRVMFGYITYGGEQDG